MCNIYIEREGPVTRYPSCIYITCAPPLVILDAPPLVMYLIPDIQEIHDINDNFSVESSWIMLLSWCSIILIADILPILLLL